VRHPRILLEGALVPCNFDTEINRGECIFHKEEINNWILKTLYCGAKTNQKHPYKFEIATPV
jgi:hypothetical protein